MVREALKVALRTLFRFPVHSIITISGLAAGMACCLLIALYVADELSYDRYHRNAETIFRIATEHRVTDRPVGDALTPGPLASAMAGDFTEVLAAVRFWKDPGRESVVVSSGERSIGEKRFFLCDPTVFRVFTFPLVRGEPESCLREPFTIVLSESASKRHFGTLDPIGRRLRVTLGETREYRVTGVMRDIPPNSHLRADFLASLSSLEEQQGHLFIDWQRADFYTYLLLPRGYPAGELEEKLRGVVGKYMGGEFTGRVRFFLQPLASIHLRSHLESEAEPNGDISTVAAFAAIALFVLLIACINFMNLATARSSARAREVAVRKILGARRGGLVVQFMGESVLTALIALLFAFSLVEMALPAFNTVTGKTLDIFYYRNLPALAGVIAATLLAGLVSGVYPAFFQSRFTPIRVLKGYSAGSASPLLREALVAVQFAISIALIICTGVVAGQLSYLRDASPGFTKEHVVVLPLRGRVMQREYERLKAELRKNPGIQDATASSSFPGDTGMPQYEFKPEGTAPGRLLALYGLMVDRDFLQTYGIGLTRGSNFSTDFSADHEQEFIINESAARGLGWDDPIGKRLSRGILSGIVIGVVRDFHFRSLHERIEPLFLAASQSRFQYLSVRLRPGKDDAALEFMRLAWKKIDPNSPFEYFLLDDSLQRLYRADVRTERIFGAFSLLSIAIACFGLFGLASFSVEQRTREIGIRRVLGASLREILFLLSKDLIRLVLIAQLLAWPVSWFAMRAWLGSFAYHADMNAWIFVLGGMLALGIALLTIGAQTWKAATANPADALRYE